MPPRRVSISGMIVALLALALFIYSVSRAGIGEIQEGLALIGWGLPFVIAVSGVRLAARTFAWRALLRHPLPLRTMLSATLAGEAIGNLLPLGPIAGEPAKVGYLRGRVPVGEPAAALGLENVFYSLSVACVIVAGMTLTVLTVALPEQLRAVALIALVAMIALVASALFVLLRRREAGFALSWVPSRLAGDWLRGIEARGWKFYASTKHRIGIVVLFETIFHAFGLAETYLVLWLLSMHTGEVPSVLDAFILESAGRVINVLFRFVPMRIGVDEAGSGAVTAALGLGAGTGVLLALSRKLRVLFWTLLGVGAIGRRGLTSRGGLQ